MFYESMSLVGDKMMGMDPITDLFRVFSAKTIGTQIQHPQVLKRGYLRHSGA